MTAQQFIELNPDFFNSELPQSRFYAKVTNQAVEHTQRLDSSSLTREARPNEPDSVKKYRDDNSRMITSAPVFKFMAKSGRIFRNAGFGVNKNSLSDKLKERLASKPYLYLSRRTDLQTFVFECVYTFAIEDPNGILIDFPYNPANPDIAPVLSPLQGGLPANESVGIETILVPSDIIKTSNQNVFSWYGGEVEVRRTESGRSSTTAQPFYWLVDKDWFYRYVPVRYDDKNRLVYELQEWYRHETGDAETKELPITLMPGHLRRAKVNGEIIHYQESLLSPLFNYADEVKTRFSDGQAVWVQHSYPKVVMKELPCPETGCMNGKVRDNKGNLGECRVCSGAGVIKNPDPFTFLVRPKENGLEEKDNSPIYELITPPTDLLQQVYDIPFDLLKKGKQEMGLDALEMVAESGTAKSMRMEDLKDTLQIIEEKMATMIETHLWHKECLLETKRGDRQRPSVNRSGDYELKTALDLREDAKDALEPDKLMAHLKYINRVYANNKSLLKAYEYAFYFSPLMLQEWQEVRDKLIAGVVDENDIVRRDNAIPLFIELSERPEFETMDRKRAFEEVEKMLVERGLLKAKAMPIIEENNITDGEATQNAA